MTVSTMLTGIGSGIAATGLILVAALVGILFLTKKSERLDYMIGKLLIVGFIAFVVGAILFIWGLVI